MGIENERERTSSMLDCKHNVLNKEWMNRKKIRQLFSFIIYCFSELIHKDLEDRNLLQDKSQKLVKIMNEKISKRRIQITDLQKQEIEEKEETNKLIRLHIFYLILLINL